MSKPTLSSLQGTDRPVTRRPIDSPPDGHRWTRRVALLGAALLLVGCAGLRGALPSLGNRAVQPAMPFAVAPPILFVHGNGDSGALWHTTFWRFESNGWPRERLFALHQPYPLARDDDTRPQPGRSSTAEHLAFLSAQVEHVLKVTGAPSVVLVANSRGGLAVRNLLANGDRRIANRISHVVLGGTPNHGVWADPADRPGNELNGAGPFLRALNSPKGPNGDEVTPGPQWLTIRSDRNDKFAQPTGEWLGTRDKPTHVTAEGPALKGATNIVLPGIDHRETSFGPQAFAETWRFLTGRAPSTLSITPEATVQLSGQAIGLGLDNQPGQGNYANNLPLAGARVEVYAVDPATGERRGNALLRQSVGPDGRWGPLATAPTTPLEFVVVAPGYATHHVYRSPFPRSTPLVQLQAARIADADRDARAIVTLSRPRGYFGIPRDEISLDGRSPPPGIPPGVAGVSITKLLLREAAPRPLAGSFNGEGIVGRLWPAAENRLVTLELHH